MGSTDIILKYEPVIQINISNQYYHVKFQNFSHSEMILNRWDWAVYNIHLIHNFTTVNTTFLLIKELKPIEFEYNIGLSEDDLH